MKKLREKGLVHMDADGYITLTEEGLAVARSTYDRHKVLTAYFISLGVSPHTAEDDACKIEHDISEETFRCIRAQMQGTKSASE